MIKKIFLATFLIVITSYSQSDTLLILTEVMFYPSSGNNEFIEVYNLSSTESIDLNNYKLKYYTSSPDLITDAGFGTLLPPNSYAVIFENDYDITSGIYKSLVPGSALIVKISDNSFGSSGMANTTSRPVWLLNSANDTIDYYFYSANNTSTYSDEKIILNHDSLETNWANSLITNGTPGFTNSVTPISYDLEIESLTFLPKIPVEQNDVTINIKIKNKGLVTADSYSLNVYNDLNKDSIADYNENIFAGNYTSLNPGDSIVISLLLTALQANEYQIIAQVDFEKDQNITNNISIKKLIVNPPGNNYNDIVINEIMYAPSSGEPEWIELYNKSSDIINLKNWKLSDANTTITIADHDIILNPDSFIVISNDSSIFNLYNINSRIIVTHIPSLNNTGDAIVIKDVIETLIDSVYYLPNWGGNINGKSLERISITEASNDQANWETSKSIFKATPGTYNSVTQKDYDLLLSDILFYPNFPLIGDNLSVGVQIKNIGKKPAMFSLDLYKDTDLDSIPDKLIESITNLNLEYGDSSQYLFNYSIENFQNKAGFYVKLIFNEDQDSTNNYFYKIIEPGYPPETIIINEIMFAPFGGEPEWVELYNNSGFDINIKNWSIWDVITTPAKAIIKSELLFKGKSYIVIARDSSVLNYHRTIPAQIIEMNVPSLNNDNDGVVIKDNRGLTIDSVFYLNRWGGTNGFSLERVSSFANSNNEFNWANSRDIEQSTPGRVNSITPKQYDVSISDITFSPRFPTTGDNIMVTAKLKNNGSNIAENCTVYFYSDTDSNGVVDFLLSSDKITITSGDSISVISNSQITSIQKKILVAVKVNFDADEDTLNNYFEKSIEPGYPVNTIKINEVMYNPDERKPEWVELINTSDDSVNLKNWLISDILPSPLKDFITNENIFIAPKEIFLIAKDTIFNSTYNAPDVKIFYSNFGSLGNSSDGLIIYDFRQGIIDSLLYHSNWGGKKGFSLERIAANHPTNDSTNWLTSLDISGSTPGKLNSINYIPSYNRNSIIINEIMYDPDSDFSEYLEFYNTTNDTINIGGWKVEDENENNYKLEETSFKIPPYDYFILIADSSTLKKFNLSDYNLLNILNTSSLGLSNNGELILLKDARGFVIDSVFYNDNWNNKNIYSTKGKSLERINPLLSSIDPQNWSTSVNPLGGTPGKVNSIFVVNLNKSSNISISPNPFSPDNDGFEDFTIINYNLSQAIAQIRIKIFDSKGRLVKTLLNNQASGSSGSVVFDGLDESGNPLKMGIYIIFLEALNDNSGVVETIKSAFVVARRL